MFRTKLKTNYRRFTYKKDPRFSGTLPKELLEDLTKLAKENDRTVKEEILARLVATMEFNEEFMSHDRVKQLIFKTKLAAKNPKK